MVQHSFRIARHGFRLHTCRGRRVGIFEQVAGRETDHALDGADLVIASSSHD
jgi:hypothetical protein